MTGFIVTKNISDSTYEIIDIATHKDYRNQGIASKLIDYIIENFNIKILYAETDDEAIGFYRKYGFNSELINKIDDTNRYRCTFNIGG